jgi:hypothetical protein
MSKQIILLKLILEIPLKTFKNKREKEMCVYPRGKEESL